LDVPPQDLPAHLTHPRITSKESGPGLAFETWEPHSPTQRVRPERSTVLPLRKSASVVAVLVGISEGNLLFACATTKDDAPALAYEI
jgi:hypothetical protein